MDDYYSLLGVEPDAATDDIRAAYRDKKALVDASDDKSDAPRLNKAWNVLSDPYQRGRYDEQRSRAEEEGELDSEELVVQANTNSRGRARGERRPRPTPQELVPTIELPAGVSWPPNRRRIAAMMTDLGVLAAIFIVGVFLVLPQINEARDKATVDRIDRLENEIDDAKQVSDDADKAADEAESKAEESGNADDEAAAEEARAKADDAKDAHQKLVDEARDASQKLYPNYIATLGAVFVLGFAYLAVPSRKGGQTLGKRLQHLRVLRADGTPINFPVAARRYGSIMGVTFALTLLPVIGIAAAAIVLIGVTRWMRDPNRQGIHDKFAKTIVVADNA
jgi:curved DNA-binding protein CbpA